MINGGAAGEKGEPAKGHELLAKISRKKEAIKLSTDISYHTGGLTIASLELSGAVVRVQLGNNTTGLTLLGELTLNSARATFRFNEGRKDSEGFEFNTPYTIVTAPNLSSFTPEQFEGNSLHGVKPTFTIDGTNLRVVFKR